MKDKKIHLTIGIPTTGNLHWRFAADLLSLEFPRHATVIWKVKTMIDAARNQIVERMLKNKDSTHLLMIDDDMTFPPKLALKMIERNKDIVGALAFHRTPEYLPCAYKGKNEEGAYFPILPDTFQEVDIVGTGGILIKRRVLEKMGFPWFTTYYDDNNIHWGVDFDFCKKATKAGFKIYVDPDVEMGHIGNSLIVGKNTFLQHISQKYNSNKNENNKNNR